MAISVGGINSSLTLHLPPPFNSLAGQTLLPASLFSSPSPFSHSTHLQPDGLQVSSSNDTASNILLAKPRSQTPSFPQAVWCPGATALRVYMDSNTTEGAPVAEGLQHRELKKKTTETEARASPATVDACTVSGWSIPGKI